MTNVTVLDVENTTIKRNNKLMLDPFEAENSLTMAGMLICYYILILIYQKMEKRERISLLFFSKIKSLIVFYQLLINEPNKLWSLWQKQMVSKL